MTIQIVLLFISLLILPGYLLFNLWRGREDSTFLWLLRVGFTGAFMVYLFMAGPWSWISAYLRYVWLALTVVAAVVSYLQLEERPFFASDGRGRWLGLANYGFTLLVALVLLGLVIRGHVYEDQPVRLAIPFQEGRYVVGQGGNSLVLNYARNSRSQQFAVDILQLNRFGARARGIYPSNPERYVIFGQTLHSPCDGTVTAAVDGLPDLEPPERDPENPAGNHVVISCQNVDLLMAHMQNGSVAVESGATVTTGQLVGRVGNSGNTTEPHLHIHAVAGGSSSVFEGDAVPLLLGGKFPTRNTVLVGD